MQPLIPTLMSEQLRQAKQNTSKYLNHLGVELTSSTIGDLTANTLGYDNYNIAKAVSEKNLADGAVASSNNHQKPSQYISLNEFEREVISEGFDSIEAKELSDWYSNFIGTVVNIGCTQECRDKYGIRDIYDWQVFLLEKFFLQIAEKHGDGSTGLWGKFIETDQWAQIARELITKTRPWAHDVVAKVIGINQKHLDVEIELMRQKLKLYDPKMPIVYTMPGQKNNWTNYIFSKMGIAKNTPYFTDQTSTCIFGGPGIGKSHLMMEWARDIATSNSIYGMVYVTDAYEPLNDPSGKLSEFVISTDDFNNKRSAIFEISKEDGYKYILTKLDSAMADNAHIFIDECKYSAEIIADIMKTGYKKLTVALKSPQQLYQIGFKKPWEMEFGRLLIGKQYLEDSSLEFKRIGLDIGDFDTKKISPRSFIETSNINFVPKILSPSQVDDDIERIRIESADYLDVDGVALYFGANENWARKHIISYLSPEHIGIYNQRLYYNRRAFEMLVHTWKADKMS